MLPIGSGFTAPTVDWIAGAPVIVVLATAVLGVLVEAFAPRGSRRTLQLALGLFGLGIALYFVVKMWLEMGEMPRILLSVADPNLAAPQGPQGLLMDYMALFLQGTLIVLSALSLLMLAERAGGALESVAAAPSTPAGSGEEREAQRLGLQATEVFPLMMFAVGGMLVFVAATDLIVLFIALEVFSLPLYILAGVARHRRLLSQEASLKYFLLGAISSAVFLFGIAIFYGMTGTVNLYEISGMLREANQSSQLSGTAIDWVETLPLLIVGALFLLVGLLFKVGAVPFHSWTPDVYMGAPTPVTGFMAACTKVAAFGAMVRVAFLTLNGLGDSMTLVLVVIAALTMIVGSVVALRQTDIKRMLAYSSIAHAGFIITGIASFQDVALTGVLFYLLAYGLSTVAAFAIVTLVRERNPDGSVGPEANNLAQWNGLARRSPVLAASFAFLLLAFAGIPLTSGFVAKFGVLAAAVSTRQTMLVVLAVIGVLASAVAVAFYLRVIVRMYFSDVGDDSTVVVPGALTAIAITVGVVATVVLGVFPAPFLDWAGAILAGGR